MTSDTPRPNSKLPKMYSWHTRTKDSKQSMDALSANISTEPTPVTRKLTPAEQKQLDQAIEADLEFWKEQKEKKNHDKKIS